MDIPCDCVLLKGNMVKVDESPMTGESDELHKEPFHVCLEKSAATTPHHSFPSPIMISGTRITTGEGLMAVIAVGDKSCKGKI